MLLYRSGRAVFGKKYLTSNGYLIDYARMKFTVKIKPQRNKVGLTQADLAAEVGVSRQTIISIEKGTCIPSTYLALRLAHVLNKPVEELFNIEE